MRSCRGFKNQNHKKSKERWLNSASILPRAALCAVAGIGLMVGLTGFAAVSSSYANPIDANSLPTGGQVVHGDVQFNYSDSHLQVNQASDKAVIDWQGFNIGKNAHTHFSQNGAHAIAVNRIKDVNPSQILGQLSADGRIVLINPNGILFGQDSMVDVSGLIASTGKLDIDHLIQSGQIKIFDATGGFIANHGQISVRDAGLAAFVAPHIANHGLIQARYGQVALSSGDVAVIDFHGDGLVQFSVEHDVAQQRAIHNSGTIEAGTVILDAGNINSLVDSVINVSGVIRAQTATKQGGRIILSGGKGTQTTVSGTVQADGKVGGAVTVTGDNITVSQGAVITATGENGGGTIKIGGDYRGQGDTYRATNTQIETGAVINASATGAQGDGGEIIVWADGATWFDGTALVRGGYLAGKRGFVETSGKLSLGVGENAVVEAELWLLDPRNVYLQNNPNGASLGPMRFKPTEDDQIVNIATIVNALNNGSNVRITTEDDTGNQDGNIYLQGDIVWTGSGQLIFDADNNIHIDGDILSSHGGLNASQGGLALLAQNSIFANNLDRNVTISTNTGNISMFAYGGDISLSGSNNYDLTIQTNSGNIRLDAARDINVGGGTGDTTIQNDDFRVQMFAGRDVNVTAANNRTTWISALGNQIASLIGRNFFSGGTGSGQVTVEANNINIRADDNVTIGTNSNYAFDWGQFRGDGNIDGGGWVWVQTGATMTGGDDLFRIRGTANGTGQGSIDYGIRVDQGANLSVGAGTMQLLAFQDHVTTGTHKATAYIGGNFSSQVGTIQVQALGDVEGAAAAKGTNNYGIYLDGANITNHDGQIRISGYAAAGQGRNMNYVSNTTITTTGSGEILLRGQAEAGTAGGMGQNIGLHIADSNIQAQGDGRIIINGFGASLDETSVSDHGIFVERTNITTVTGNIGINAQSGTGSDNYGMRINNAGGYEIGSQSGLLNIAAMSNAQSGVDTGFMLSGRIFGHGLRVGSNGVLLTGQALVESSGGYINLANTGTFQANATNIIRQSGSGIIRVQQSDTGSIQNAINAVDAASANLAMVKLNDGHFIEDIELNRAIKLMSTERGGMPTLEGAGVEAAAIRVTSAGASIGTFVEDNTEPAGSEIFGLRIVASGNQDAILLGNNAHGFSMSHSEIHAGVNANGLNTTGAVNDVVLSYNSFQGVPFTNTSLRVHGSDWVMGGNQLLGAPTFHARFVGDGTGARRDEFLTLNTADLAGIDVSSMQTGGDSYIIGNLAGALTLASNGASIYLPAGTYDNLAGLDGNKGLTIYGDGAGQTIIVGNNLVSDNGYYDIVSVTGNARTTTIRDLTIDGSNVDMAGFEPGGYLVGLRMVSTNVNVENVEITGIQGANSYAVYAASPSVNSTILMQNVNIHDVSNALHVNRITNFKIFNSTLSGDGTGIGANMINSNYADIGTTANNGNIIEGFDTGVIINGSNNFDLKHNIIRNNNRGVLLINNPFNARIEYNQITNNTTGIELGTSSTQTGAFVLNNTITGNDTGVLGGTVNSSTFNHNIIHSNVTGIQLGANSTSNTIRYNVFGNENNTSQGNGKAIVMNAVGSANLIRDNNFYGGSGTTFGIEINNTPVKVDMISNLYQQLTRGINIVASVAQNIASSTFYKNVMGIRLHQTTDATITANNFGQNNVANQANARSVVLTADTGTRLRDNYYYFGNYAIDANGSIGLYMTRERTHNMTIASLRLMNSTNHDIINTWFRNGTYGVESYNVTGGNFEGVKVYQTDIGIRVHGGSGYALKSNSFSGVGQNYDIQ